MRLVHVLLTQCRRPISIRSQIQGLSSVLSPRVPQNSTACSALRRALLLAFVITGGSGGGRSTLYGKPPWLRRHLFCRSGGSTCSHAPRAVSLAYSDRFIRFLLASARHYGSEGRRRCNRPPNYKGGFSGRYRDGNHRGDWCARWKSCLTVILGLRRDH